MSSKICSVLLSSQYLLYSTFSQHLHQRWRVLSLYHNQLKVGGSLLRANFTISSHFSAFPLHSGPNHRTYPSEKYFWLETMKSCQNRSIHTGEVHPANPEPMAGPPNRAKSHTNLYTSCALASKDAKQRTRSPSDDNAHDFTCA